MSFAIRMGASTGASSLEKSPDNKSPEVTVAVSQDSALKAKKFKFKRLPGPPPTSFDDLYCNFEISPPDRVLHSILKYGSIKTNDGLRSVSFNFPDGYVDKCNGKMFRKLRKRSAEKPPNENVVGSGVSILDASQNIEESPTKVRKIHREKVVDDCSTAEIPLIQIDGSNDLQDLLGDPYDSEEDFVIDKPRVIPPIKVNVTKKAKCPKKQIDAT